MLLVGHTQYVHGVECVRSSCWRQWNWRRLGRTLFLVPVLHPDPPRRYTTPYPPTQTPRRRIGRVSVRSMSGVEGRGLPSDNGGDGKSSRGLNREKNFTILGENPTSPENN